MSGKSLSIDVWSDVVCPWCYIGKRRLEAALERFEERASTSVTWHAFELDPSAPRAYQDGSTLASRLARKYGKSPAATQGMIDQVTRVAAGDGLEFHFERERSGNTFDAHRLLAFARGQGLQGALKERLLRAYFTEGQAIGDRETLARLGVEVGLDEAETRAVLGGDRFSGEVRQDQAAARSMGATGVPFFVVGRRYAVGGAQAPEALLRVLQRAWSEGLAEVVAEGPSCDAEGCTLKLRRRAPGFDLARARRPTARVAGGLAQIST